MTGDADIDLKPVKLVVVEDDLHFTEAVVSELKRHHPSVDTIAISTASDAISRSGDIVSFAPDAAVVDVILPWCELNKTSCPPLPDKYQRELAGVRVVEHMRQQEALRDLPIILTSSGWLAPAWSLLSSTAGIVGLQQKEVDGLCALIKNVLFLPEREPLRFVLSQECEKKLFISYSHCDRDWLNVIRLALQPHLRSGRIIEFDDRQLEQGIWRDQIERQMQEAGAVLFLASMSFCGSEFINTVELPYFKEAHKRRRIKLTWIALSAGDFREVGLDRYTCLNDPSVPLDRVRRPDRASVLVQCARKLVECMRS